MNKSQHVQGRGDQSRFIRFGGIAILLGFLIHIVANGVLKQFPPEDPTLEQLKAYRSEEASTWALVHGLRYVAFVCIVFFAAALFVRTCRTWGSRSMGWGLVGLLGAALHVATGTITNGSRYSRSWTSVDCRRTRSSSLPRWLTMLGFLGAIGTLACGVFIVSILSDGRAGPLAGIVSLGCLAWFLTTGMLMAFQGAAGSMEDAV